MLTLADFGPGQPPAPAPQQQDPTHEESVPLGPVPIRNFALVRQLIQEAFKKDPERTALLLTSNGSEDRPATEWYLKRVVN